MCLHSAYILASPPGHSQFFTLDNWEWSAWGRVIPIVFVHLVRPRTQELARPLPIFRGLRDVEVDAEYVE